MALRQEDTPEPQGTVADYNKPYGFMVVSEFWGKYPKGISFTFIHKGGKGT